MDYPFSVTYSKVACLPENHQFEYDQLRYAQGIFMIRLREYGLDPYVKSDNMKKREFKNLLRCVKHVSKQACRMLKCLEKDYWKRIISYNEYSGIKAKTLDIWMDVQTLFDNRMRQSDK